MRKLFLCLCVYLLAGNASAGVVVVDFPTDSSTSTASAAEYFYLTSHSVSETFTGTGLDGISGLDLMLELDHNNLNDGGFVDFDVLVNATTVGSFSFDENDALGFYNFSYSFAEIFGAGEYELTLQVTNDVPSGDGSVGFSEETSTATLIGDVSEVPEPVSLALLGLGLAGLGFSRRFTAR